MPEQSMELRRINWSECFSFTNIFRTFKLAVQPTKLGLGLVAVLLTGIWGWALDGVWSSTAKVWTPEVTAYWQVEDIDEWRDQAADERARILPVLCGPIEVDLPENLDEQLASDPGRVFATTLRRVREKYHDALTAMEAEWKENAPEDPAAERAALGRKYAQAYEAIRERAPQGIFRSFTGYQAKVAKQFLTSARHLNFLGGLEEVMTARVPGEDTVFERIAGLLPQAPLDAGLVPVKTGGDGFGALACVALAIRGVQWIVVQHPGFAVLFGLPALVIWAIFGGAICRITAMSVAREEHLSAGAALAFARRKAVAFVTAPLFPVLLVIGIGIPLIVGGLVMAIPGLGEILGGLGMGLALLGGFLMSAVVIGGLAGGSLMWPTIAVEGSDSFDAMSRSYSYVFTRPWRAVLYAVTLTVYGAVCYLFARFFVVVLLKVTRAFVATGMAWVARPGTGDVGASKIDTLWPPSSFDQILVSANPIGMQNWEGGGAFLIGLWVLIIAGLLYAFVASFYLSGATMVYFLLRRKVDATDLEDIYLEEDEADEPMLDLPASSGVSVGEATTPSAESAKPKPKPEPPQTPPAKNADTAEADAKKTGGDKTGGDEAGDASKDDDTKDA